MRRLVLLVFAAALGLLLLLRSLGPEEDAVARARPAGEERADRPEAELAAPQVDEAARAAADAARAAVPSDAPTADQPAAQPSPSAVVLHVRDAATRAELESVDVHVTALSSSFLALASSAPPPPDLAGVRSPLVLRADAFDAKQPPWQLDAEAPGYVRATLDHVDPAHGGHVFLDLARAGALDVRMVDPPPSAMLRVWSAGARDDADGEPALLAEVRRSTTAREVVEGLPLGPVRVALEAGSWWAERLVYAEVDAYVGPGPPAVVTLACPSREPVPRSRVDVHLELPVRWVGERPVVRLYRVGPPAAPGEPDWSASGTVEPLPGDARGTLDVAFEAVPPGPYLVDVARRWSARVDVPPHAVRLAVHVPDLARIALTVVDPDGRALPPAEVELTWRVPEPEGLPGRPRVGAQRYAVGTPSAFPVELAAPAGPLELRAWSSVDPLLRAARTFDTVPGPQPLTLRLERHAGLAVRLHDPGPEDGTGFDVPWTGRLRWSLRTPGGTGFEPAPERLRDDDLTLRLLVPASGPAVFEVGALDGYRPVPPLPVELHPGSWSAHVVPLRRD